MRAAGALQEDQGGFCVYTYVGDSLASIYIIRILVLIAYVSLRAATTPKAPRNRTQVTRDVRILSIVLYGKYGTGGKDVRFCPFVLSLFPMYYIVLSASDISYVIDRDAR